MVSNAHYVKLDNIEEAELHKKNYEAEAYRSDTETGMVSGRSRLCE